MEKYYQTRKITPVEFERFDRTLSLGLESMSFMTAEVILRDGGKRALVIEQIGPEEFVVDWESEVCYQPIEWKTYLEEKVTTPMDMRVYIIPDNFYAYLILKPLLSLTSFMPTKLTLSGFIHAQHTTAVL